MAKIDNQIKIGVLGAGKLQKYFQLSKSKLVHILFSEGSLLNLLELLVDH